jgi:hypothetical protein
MWSNLYGYVSDLYVLFVTMNYFSYSIAYICDTYQSAYENCTLDCGGGLGSDGNTDDEGTGSSALMNVASAAITMAGMLIAIIM